MHYDIVYLREEAKVNIRSLVDDKLPSEYAECLTGLHLILREVLCHISCYNMKLDMLTNIGVLNDAVRFVSDYKNKKIMTFKIEPERDATTDELSTGKQTVF